MTHIYAPKLRISINAYVYDVILGLFVVVYVSKQYLKIPHVTSFHSQSGLVFFPFIDVYLYIYMYLDSPNELNLLDNAGNN